MKLVGLTSIKSEEPSNKPPPLISTSRQSVKDIYWNISVPPTMKQLHKLSINTSKIKGTSPQLENCSDLNRRCNQASSINLSGNTC